MPLRWSCEGEWPPRGNGSWDPPRLSLETGLRRGRAAGWGGQKDTHPPCLEKSEYSCCNAAGRKGSAGVGFRNGDRTELLRGVPPRNPAPGRQVAVLNVPDAGCVYGVSSCAGRPWMRGVGFARHPRGSTLACLPHPPLLGHRRLQASNRRLIRPCC